MDQARFSYLCCNPFDKPNHSSKRKNLRSVLPWRCERVHSIQLGAKICDECRKQLGKLPITDPTTESSACTPVTESSESVVLQKSCYSGVCESVFGGDWRDPSGEEKTPTSPLS